jgi:hypothetical protein
MALHVYIERLWTSGVYTCCMFTGSVRRLNIRSRKKVSCPPRQLLGGAMSNQNF